MDFWARQAAVRQRSRWLVAAFLAAVVAVIVAINFVVVVFLAIFDRHGPARLSGAWLADHPQSVVTTTFVVLAIVSIASLYKVMALSAGGGVVARSLGGMRIQADTTDSGERRLLHVVEEMAIASGLPVPAVYVLEQEEGINAFAAGYTPVDAAITVTRGALLHLDRAELQGVIGHEFSHILNGDMRLNTRLMGMLFGLLVIALAGRMAFRHVPPRNDVRGRSGLLVVAGLAVMSVGYVGVFVGRLIQAAVSRQLEFLADASAVQFTRDPAGLRDALVKIGSVGSSRLAHPAAEEVAHMLFAPGMTRWFATHPPLAARIRALDACFDPAVLARLRLEVRPQPLGIVRVQAEDGLRHDRQPPAAQGGSQLALDPGTLARRVANPGPAEIVHARALREALPEGWLTSDDQTWQATALLLAMVLDPAPRARNAQLKQVEAAFGTALDDALAVQEGRLRTVPVERRLALLGRIVPNLQRQPPAVRQRILDVLAALSRADGVISVFEYALGALARTYLDESLAPRRRARAVRLDAATAEVQILFATLAVHGHAGEAAAQEAFQRGIARLGLRQPLRYRNQPGWAAGLDRALRCLDGLAPADKARLVEALGATVVHDGRVTVAEGELLRATCAVLHCPLPPLSSGGDSAATTR